MDMVLVVHSQKRRVTPEPEPDRRKVPNATLCCAAHYSAHSLLYFRLPSYVSILPAILLGDDHLILMIKTYFTSASGEESKASTLPPCQEKNDTLRLTAAAVTDLFRRDV
jgi:hypothetical protein